MWFLAHSNDLRVLREKRSAPSRSSRRRPDGSVACLLAKQQPRTNVFQHHPAIRISRRSHEAHSDCVSGIPDAVTAGPCAGHGTTRRENTIKWYKMVVEYIEEYLRLHSGSRLDKKQDEKKAKIIKDERLKNLEAIAPILSANSQIVELREQISTLKPCYGLTKDYLENSPICPMCSYKPAAETLGAPAGLILDNLQEKLDEMLENWTQKLVGMLEDPIVQNNIKNLLSDDQRKTLEDFLYQRKLPSKVTSEFVAACNQALESLVRVTINKDELMGSLVGQGGPVTIDELSERLEKYLSELTRGNDPVKVRIVSE